jgi:hypothetical protein
MLINKHSELQRYVYLHDEVDENNFSHWIVDYRMNWWVWALVSLVSPESGQMILKL